MTQSQLNAQSCGLIPEENPPEFFAKHLSAYHFLKKETAGKRVLEVGFGDGYGMNYLSDTAKEVAGVDIAPMNIPSARAKYPDKKLTFLKFNGLDFPFEDGRFDIVCTFQVIEHVPEAQWVAWLTEIKRVLKPGGALYVSTLNLRTAKKAGVAYEKNVDHEKEFYVEELETLLKRVFRQVRLFGLHYSFKHRLFRRLKKWGLARLGFVRAHFLSASVKDFVVKSVDLERSIDIFAVCRKIADNGRDAKG